MEIGLAILLFICMTALLYVILSLKITRQVDLQMKEFYKTRIHQDMQEFYRDMEGYAAHFESQIQRLRTLSERVGAMPPAPPEQEVMVSPPIEKSSKIPVSKKTPLKKEPVRPVKSAKKSQAVKAAPLAKGANKKSVAPTPPAKPALVQKPLPVTDAAPVATPLGENDDVTIAEELMKDLFQQDEVRIGNRPQAALAKAAPAREVAPAETEGEKTMSNFFSRLGRAIEPVIFGDKNATRPAQDIARNLAPEPAQAAVPRSAGKSPDLLAPVQSKATSNFSEVLKRAEQIKAEKKAERERSEVEARAEFYAQGDAYAPLAESFEAVPRPPVREVSRRNTLAVKELDQHTINFLIDSLVQDNGYRKQALRALTENNIPLTEIARLSKIDIGELELMRQLGRF